MPGSKTRFGFSGADEPSPIEGDAPDTPRAARTIIGHETHRPGEPIAPSPGPGVEVASAVPTPEQRADAPVAVVREEVTERVLDRRHTGKSKFPAIARLLGRWTTAGGWLSRSRMLQSDEALPALPRNVWPSRIVIFLGAALLSFLIALAVMKVGHLE